MLGLTGFLALLVCIACFPRDALIALLAWLALLTRSLARSLAYLPAHLLLAGLLARSLACLLARLLARSLASYQI